MQIDSVAYFLYFLADLVKFDVEDLHVMALSIC